MVSKFHNGIHDSKGHENKIKTIVKSMSTFYRRHTVLVHVASCCEAIYVFFKSFNTDLKTKGLSELWQQLYILTGYDTNSKVGTNLSALKLPAVQLLSKFGKSLSSPIPFKMKSYAKLSNNLSKYSKPTDNVLLWIILGIKYTTEVN